MTIALSTGFVGHAALGEQTTRKVCTLARSCCGRSGSARRIRSAASAAATDPGVFDAVKINVSDVSVSSSIASAAPMSAPPHDPSVFENVIVTRSMSSSTPYCSAAPRPRSPSTPRPWASSSRRNVFGCFAATSTTRSSGAVSPPIE